MALAPISRDQGSLSGLVYSFFPPASCQAPLPAIGFLSPCTFACRPPPHSCLLTSLTLHSENLSALLEAFLNI
ncbi:mCG142724 [Mus musculus]|nr:mCG142724 [Mus musculus]